MAIKEEYSDEAVKEEDSKSTSNSNLSCSDSDSDATSEDSTADVTSEDSDESVKSEDYDSESSSESELSGVEHDQTLNGYQSLCREVNITPPETEVECQMELKKTLVNIVDFIDAKRIRKTIEVWDDWQAFGKYTLGDPKKRINSRETKEPLRGLLQRLRGTLANPARDPRTLKKKELRALCNFNANSRIKHGRITKKR